MNAFAKYTQKNTCRQIAEELGITPQYVHLLQIGARCPSLQRAIEIEKWSKGKVRVESWRGNEK